MENILQAGFCCQEIQPPLGLNIPGYYHARPAEGTADPLRMRAAAFACGDEKAVIFNVESIGIRTAAFDIIKKHIAKSCDISEDAIYINCVHSHTSFRILPVTEVEDLLDLFMLRLYMQFADVAKLAFQDLKPAKILTASGEAKNIAFVRRYRMADGTVRTNPPVSDPSIVGPVDTPDEQLRMIRIQREGAKEICMLHFGTHADTVGGRYFCPDWPGYLVDQVNAALEGKVEAMFLLGCEGNCGTRNAIAPVKRPPKGVGLAKFMARQLTGVALQIYDRAKPVAADCVRVAHTHVQIGKNAWDPEKLPQVEELVKLYREGGEHAPGLDKYPELHYREALRIHANLSRPEFFNLRISGVRIGDVSFVGIPGEPFSTIGMDIAAQSPAPMTVVTACTNGHEGYYPDVKAYGEPGYCYEKATSPFAADCATHLISGALEVLNQLNK